MALIVALAATVLMVALASAVSLLTGTETRIAGNHRAAGEVLHAADAALAVASLELAAAADWNAILAGGLTSSCVDGAPGVRETMSGSIELGELTNTVRTDARPWGANNPIWQLYAHGRLRNMVGGDSDVYVVVWVGDDPAECDGRPDVDGAPCPGANAGKDVISVLVHAYGAAGTRRAIEATFARTPDPLHLRPLSWREVR